MITKTFPCLPSFSILSTSIVLLILTGCGGHQQKPAPEQATTQRPKRRSGPKNTPSYFVGKSIKQTNQAEALFCKDYYQKRGDKSLASKYLEHLLTLVKDHQLRGELILELADTSLELDRRDRAANLYKQYKILYPGSPAIKYVLYKEITARQKDSLPSAHDQTKTRQTLALTKEFLQEFPGDAEYTDAVKSMQRVTVLTLVRSELNIANFYLSKFNYEPKPEVLEAGKLRLDHILQEYLPLLDDAGDFAQLDLTEQFSTPVERQQFLQTVVKTLESYVDAQLPAEYSFFNLF